MNNPPQAAALEFTYVGPTLLFKQDAAIALTGAKMIASLDGVVIPYYQTVHVKAGSVLSLQHIEGGGTRTYLAIEGTRCFSSLTCKVALMLRIFLEASLLFLLATLVDLTIQKDAL